MNCRVFYLISKIAHNLFTPIKSTSFSNIFNTTFQICCSIVQHPTSDLLSYEDCHLRNGKKIVVLGKNEPAAGGGEVNVIVTTVEDGNFPKKNCT